MRIAHIAATVLLAASTLVSAGLPASSADNDLKHGAPPTDSPLRVLAKLGFTEGLWFDEPQSDGRVDTVVACSLDVAQVMGVAGSPSPVTQQ